ncbi:Mor transcription activator family protein [Ferrimonas sp.]|uniref:Mor transcription activator family protein n=1 Tax=Ferrimonas sp. TaxID=2080861 RepID=UPI003A8CC8B0
MSEKQLDLIASTADELEATLEALEGLTETEREDLRRRWPSILQSLSELFRVTLEERKIANAERLAEALVTALGTYMGGRDLYIPTGTHLKKALTHIAIWRAYKGNNIAQLAAQYGLTERRVAQIVQNQRQAEMARRQKQLF